MTGSSSHVPVGPPGAWHQLDGRHVPQGQSSPVASSGTPAVEYLCTVFNTSFATAQSGAHLPRCAPPLGHPPQAPAADTPPPPFWDSSRPSNSTATRHNSLPFTGSYRGATWNSQGLLAYDVGTQDRKRELLGRLLQHDMVHVQETHGTDGTAAAVQLPPEVQPFWSHCSRHQGGIALIVKKSFLHNFDTVRLEDWEQRIPGRLAALHLRGPSGALSVVTAYFPSGPRGADERKEMRHALRDLLRSRPGVLWITAGDFNWVPRTDDRYCLESSSFTGARDTAEEEHWRTTIAEPLHMREIGQKDMTFKTAQSCSRLDRVYTNHHTADFCRSTFFAAAWPWPHDVSDHRPVSYGRRIVDPEGRPPSLSDHVTQHPDWPKRVAREYHQQLHTMLADGLHPDPIQKLVAIKQAMRSVGQTMTETRGGADHLLHCDPADTAATAFRLIAAIEQGIISTTSRLRKKLTRHWIGDVLSPGGSLPSAVLLLKDKATQLLKGEVLQDMRCMQAEGPGACEHQSKTRHNSINARLARLCRKIQDVGLHVMEDDDHVVHSEPARIAELLQNHWAKVFGYRDIDQEKMEAWIRVSQRAGSGRVTAPAGAWKLRTKDVQRALRIAGNSRPGPDGVPFGAWRRLGPLAVHLLWEAGRFLAAGLQADVTAHDSFNESLLVCLPKQALRVDQDGSQVYNAESTRPLSITNTDNRIIASSYRLRWEPLIAPAICDDQRGFIQGRSMLRNIIEVEHAAMIASLEERDAAIVLFDFASAFPSVARKYLMASAAAAGLPEYVMMILESLYHNTTGVLLLHGRLYGQVPMAAGIRQGCPLSPLLFALASDGLLRVLRYRHPMEVTRAFADDTAMVLRSWSREACAVFRTFRAFSMASGLELNFAKTVAIPLWDENPVSIQARLLSDPQMPHIAWDSSSKYLGVFIGPGKGARSWQKPIAKFESRLLDWKWAEMGLHAALQTYNTFVLSVLLFVAQLESPPESFTALEAKAVRRIAPGPGEWCSPRDLHHGDDLGLSGHLRPLLASCRASMLRVHAWEGKPWRPDGIAWGRLCRDLVSARQATTFLVRAARWQDWYHSHMPTVAEAIAQEAAKASIHMSAARAAITKVPAGPLSPQAERSFRRKTQRWFAAKLLARDGFYTEERLRHRLTRWHMGGFPGRTARTAHRNLLRLKALAPPRVRAAVLSTLFNRWTTNRRMRKLSAAPGQCRLGCKPEAADSLEHYFHCQVLRDWIRVRLHEAEPEYPIERWLLATTLSDAQLGRTAVAIYVAYRATQHLRHKCSVSSAYITHHMNQLFHEAVRGSSALQALCEGREVCHAAKRRKRRRHER